MQTGVSGPGAKLYSLRISMRAIFVSSRANLSLIQLHGPQPNCVWANCGQVAFASGVNLARKMFTLISTKYHNYVQVKVKPNK